MGSMGLQKGDRVAVLTSGGDAPGMNAAIRAAARVGAEIGLDMVGVEDGYAGLIEGRVAPLDIRVLDEAARRGGTALGTARSKAFATADGQMRARDTIAKHDLRGLLVIGGNGSLTGARTLTDVVVGGGATGGTAGGGTESGKLIVGGVPASIDNDLACTSMAIGVDTAMNTIVEACDRIFDTATAHKRTFIVEVMGRDCGYLAMTAGIAAGADAVLVREADKDEGQIVDQVVRTMQRAYGPQPDGTSTKRRVLVIKSEGVQVESTRLKDLVEARIKTILPDVDTRVTVLGHVVRGGTPTAFDRLLGARLANAALRAMVAGQTDFMAGWSGPSIVRAACPWDPYVVLTPLEEVLAETAKLMRGDSDLARWRKRVFAEVEDILQR
ncbi:MAG: 6-phosphofructokinase 1 [Myxococcales bacterium]|jgi:6-phosphofructokinase 1|nr:6-phosphofructokinase 1 [Myxococcales bacterium]